MRWGMFGTIGLGAGLAAVLMAYNYHGIMGLTEQSAQIYLRLYGESLYEYHALTGKWPTRSEDLALTSLPLQNPQWWKSQLDSAAVVIVWPKNIHPDPKDNGHLILCYYNKGLDAEQGKIWVCWGDLRTGWITAEQLHATLNEQQINQNEPEN